MRILVAAATVLAFAGCSGAFGPGMPILMYHSVGEGDDAYAVTETDFVAQLDWLKAAGYTTITLRQYLDSEDGKAKLPRQPIVVTFDDGYEDSYRRAMPLLRERGQVGTFFVVSDFIGADAAHRRVEGGRRFLIWPEVREMAAAGMEIGSHSLSHRRLPELPPEEIRRDVQRSRQEIEAGSGRKVDLFAYPYNSERKYVRRIVEEAGYRAAVSGSRSRGDRFELPRIGVHRGMTANDLRRRLDENWARSYTSRF
jgi:peptidoglycan/xylan/chitin deacetylase (PgdA/CDA1 family)